MANQRRPRLCRACGKLIGSENTSCPYCGRKESPVDGVIDSVFKGREFARIFLFVNIAVAILVALMASRMQVDQGEVLYRFGMLYPRAVAEGEIYRLMTAIFLHAGVLHLLFNGYFLFAVGPDVERGYGTEKFLLIYLAAGVLANVASCFLSESPSVGASGALFGLVGSYVAFGLRTKQEMVTKRAIGWGITLFLIGLLMGSRINHIAHGFGFLGGLGMAYLLNVNPETVFWRKRAIQIGALVLLLAVPISFAFALYRSFGMSA